ncbi:4Fe-4S cluster-binding domain-containing protein [Candidatus Woesearchaeota archaeon]|nr:4Fe-4S cluster-binding domain-containing protein [Candidatus Woesearchaeota archaeon]
MQGYIAGVLLNSETVWHRNTAIGIFFAGCDFKCPACTKPKITDFKEEFRIDIKDVKEAIRVNAHISNAVLFTGGEPCLQREVILDIAKYAKSLSLKTGIETNGSKPLVLRKLVKDGLLNFLSIDFRAPMEPGIFEKLTKSKTFFIDTEEIIMNFKRSLIVAKRYNPQLQLQFRTTIVPGLLYRKEDILEIAKIIRHFSCTWKLEQFNPSLPTLNPNMQNLFPVSQQFMENLKEACLEQYPNLRIEIVNYN